MEKVKISTVDDISENLQLLKSDVLIRKCGHWGLRGHDEVVIDTRLFNTLADLFIIKFRKVLGENEYEYKLARFIAFTHYERFIKQLCRITYNKKFWTLIDLKLAMKKFGYEVRKAQHINIIPTKYLVFTKGIFEIYIPYYKVTDLVSPKNGLFKVFCKLACEFYLEKNPYPYTAYCSVPDDWQLKRAWQRKFDEAAEKVLEWAHEGGQRGIER